MAKRTKQSEDLSSPEVLAAADVGYWASEVCRIELQRGPYTFDKHEWQIEPMMNNSQKIKRVCYKKATRGGFSEIEILDSLHGMIHGIYREGVLYLFPTTDDVQEFSKSRFNPLITKNRRSIGQYVKSAGKGTDTTSLKKVGEHGMLYLRGARLSEKKGDAVEESSKLKGIGVDKFVADEVDHMNDKAIAKARGRYYDSPWQLERFIGNPIIPGKGVDKQWALSDQRYWTRKCRSCGEWTCAKRFFLEDPERCVGVRADGTGYIACKKCGREVFISDAVWVPDYPDRTDYMRGYTWSHLDSYVIDPLDVLRDYRNPPEDNFADVMRLRLGEAYIEDTERLTLPAVYACCGHEGPKAYSDGPCVIGIDVGKKKHVVIGKKTGKKSYTILRTMATESWDELADLIRRYNVKVGGIDWMPETEKARDLQRVVSGQCSLWLCRYNELQPQLQVFDEPKKLIVANRTGIFDATHEMIASGMAILPRRCPETEEFAKQLCDAYKLLELNKRTQTHVYRYFGDNEHFRNALNYFLLAANKAGIAGGSRRGTGTGRRPEFADNDYNRLVYARN